MSERVQGTWREAKAIQLIATGKSDTEIATEIECNPRTIARIKDANKSKVEAQKQKFIDSLEDAVENHVDLVKRYKMIPSDDPEKKLAFEANRDVLKTVGILPTNTPVFNFNDNRTQVLSTSVESIVTKLFGGATGHSTVNNEPVDTESTEIIVDNQ